MTLLNGCQRSARLSLYSEMTSLASYPQVFAIVLQVFHLCCVWIITRRCSDWGSDNAGVRIASQTRLSKSTMEVLASKPYGLELDVC